jgi:hypothetical protein
MQMNPQIYNFRKKILSGLKLNPAYKADALHLINAQVKAGILGETENLLHHWMTRVVNRMDQPEHYLMRNTKCSSVSGTTRGLQFPVFTKKGVTSSGYEFLILSSFASKGFGSEGVNGKRFDNYERCTPTEKHIIFTLTPVGVNGVKKEDDPEAVGIYIDNIEQIFQYLIPRAQFWVRLDCLTGPFNELCFDRLEAKYGVNPDNMYATTKRHSREYWDAMEEKAINYSSVFNWGPTFHNYITGAVKRDQWIGAGDEIGLFGDYMHKYGQQRWAPGLDLLGIHRVTEDVKEACKEHFYRTGKPALVVVMDDSVSRYACSAKTVVHQLGPYATVIVIAAMFEY